MSDAVILGIDFGISKNFVGFLRRTGPQVLVSTKGQYSIPLLVAFDSHGVYVGEPAEVFLVKAPSALVCDIKRFIGRGFRDPRIQEWRKFWPFLVSAERSDTISVTIDVSGTEYRFSPRLLIQEIIRDLARRVHEAESRVIVGAVVSTPSQFTDDQRAGLRAALQERFPAWPCIDVIDDLEAIARADAIPQKEKRKTVLIVDFGAGHIDVGLVQIDSRSTPKVLRKSGSLELGGRDLDRLLAEQCLARLPGEFISSLDPQRRLRLVFGLLERCRKAMELLSTETEADIDLTFGQPQLKGGSYHITREDFDALCEHRYAEAVQYVKHVVSDAPTIDDVLLLGGCNQIPAIRRRILHCVRWKDDGREFDLFVCQGAILAASKYSQPSVPSVAAPNSYSSAVSFPGLPPLAGSSPSPKQPEGPDAREHMEHQLVELKRANAELKHKLSRLTPRGSGSAFVIPL